MTVDEIIDGIIQREGGFVDHPSDLGGPTNHGITLRVLSAWLGREASIEELRELPRSTAAVIYLQRYFIDPRFNKVRTLSAPIAEELVDTGVNMGPPRAVQMLQTALNALNKRGTLWPELRVDGVIGSFTLHALGAYLRHRGPEGEHVLLLALNCLQGARYIHLTQTRPENEDFVYGWLRTRVSLNST